MKRIWFVQQNPFEYRPLRVGLGLITEQELNAPGMTGLCPKIYTTRTHPLRGEYYVVEGSRFKAKPVEPRIEFQVRQVAKLNLHGVLDQQPGNEFDFFWNTFPEQDLGVKGVTFEMLRDELLRLNKKASIDTPFYVNRLEPVQQR